jgi:aarF domain-containing kinase
MKGFNVSFSPAFALARAKPSPSPWTCRRCLLQTQHGARTQRQYSARGNGFPRVSKRKGRVLLAATGGALGVTATAAVAFGDDVRHAYGAFERTGRVVGTLAVCINE